MALVLSGSLSLLGFVLFHERMVPSVAIPGPLQVDMVALALLGTTVLPPRARASAPRLARQRVVPGVAVGGALLGAAVVSPWIALPWLALPALAFVWVNRRGWGDRRSLYLAVLALSAMGNLAALSLATAHGLRVDPESFAERSFRVNDLLADVPLHDAWVIPVQGPESLTLEEVTAAFRETSPFRSTPALVGLALIRGILGGVLGWDDPRWADPEASFVGRLDEGDRLRSTTEPGTPFGPWRVVYTFPEEGVIELMNGTVHVAVACTLWMEGSDPVLFLSFRVREVNWSTSYYMGMINPFRRYLVYPPLLRQFAHTLVQR